METKNEFFAKQYFANKQENELICNNTTEERNTNSTSSQDFDQPIDLTYTNPLNDEDSKVNLPKLTEVLQNPSYFKQKRNKRKFGCTKDGKLFLLPNEATPPQFSNISDQNVESKQAVVLKAAKSLFSKRTRTLYHWMYPHTPKQQIKTAVANSWESLGVQEKEFYISQVLGRFGFPQSSLMVNPQLCGIKHLTPANGLQDFNRKAQELQSAISSIIPEGVIGENSASSGHGNFDEYQEVEVKVKKRRGRPSGSRSKKNQRPENVTNNIANDFQDDPELSMELQQFALNMFKTK